MILIAVLFFALALALFGDYSWSNVLSKTRNDLVFEGRNKEYGAYQIRNEDSRNTMWAILLTIGIVTLALLSARWLSARPAPVPVPETEEVIWRDEVWNIEPKQELPKQEKQSGSNLPEHQPQQENLPVEVEEDPIVEDPIEELTEPTGPATGGPGPITLGGGGGSPVGGGDEPEEVETTNKIFDFASKMPEFVGGDEAKLLYVAKNAHYPYRAKDVGLEGTIYVQFVIDANGYVRDAKVVRSVLGGADLEKEALRVINNMPRWIPGMSGEHAVAVRQILPVKFVLNK